MPYCSFFKYFILVKNRVFFSFSFLFTHLLFHLFYIKWMCQRFLFFFLYIFHLKLACITNERSSKSKITNFTWFFFVFIYSTLLLASLLSTSFEKKKKKCEIYIGYARSCFFDNMKVYCLSNLNSLYKWMISVSISYISETSQVNVINPYYKWQAGDSWLERGGSSVVGVGWSRRSMIMSSLIYLTYNYL
jgi:hypothetical protein